MNRTNYTDVSGTTVYHDTLGSALDEVSTYAARNGLTLLDVDGQPLPFVSCAPLYATQTGRVSVRATKPDARRKSGVREYYVTAAIYRLESGRYELTVYHC
jgi:hypothetical protein